MKSISCLMAVILLTSTNAIRISGQNEINSKNTNHGIFSGMIAEIEEDGKIDGEISGAKERKKKQLEEAEKEHEKAVKEEEQEDKEKEEKLAKEYEERESDKKYELA